MSNETKTESLLITLCRSEQAAEDYFQSLCINQKSYHYPKKGFRAGAKWMHDNVVPILAAKDREIAELKQCQSKYDTLTERIRDYLHEANKKQQANADRPMSEAYIEANACKVLLEILLNSENNEAKPKHLPNGENVMSAIKELRDTFTDDERKTMLEP